MCCRAKLRPQESNYRIEGLRVNEIRKLAYCVGYLIPRCPLIGSLGPCFLDDALPVRLQNNPRSNLTHIQNPVVWASMKCPRPKPAVCRECIRFNKVLLPPRCVPDVSTPFFKTYQLCRQGPLVQWGIWVHLTLLGWETNLFDPE
jgi:hypothetical protein